MAFLLPTDLFRSKSVPVLWTEASFSSTLIPALVTKSANTYCTHIDTSLCILCPYTGRNNAASSTFYLSATFICIFSQQPSHQHYQIILQVLFLNSLFNWFWPSYSPLIVRDSTTPFSFRDCLFFILLVQGRLAAIEKVKEPFIAHKLIGKACYLQRPQCFQESSDRQSLAKHQQSRALMPIFRTRCPCLRSEKTRRHLMEQAASKLLPLSIDQSPI